MSASIRFELHRFGMNGIDSHRIKSIRIGIDALLPGDLAAPTIAGKRRDRSGERTQGVNSEISPTNSSQSALRASSGSLQCRELGDGGAAHLGAQLEALLEVRAEVLEVRLEEG